MGRQKKLITVADGKDAWGQGWEKGNVEASKTKTFHENNSSQGRTVERTAGVLQNQVKKEVKLMN